MRAGVQLITYADRLGAGDLQTIRRILNEQFCGVFTGVHLLPFFTPFDGADAGFDPTDHTTVDPRLGTWDDVAAIAATHDVMADLIVNHVSDESPQFRDFVANGDASEYAGMFLEVGTVFPNGATDEELDAIYRPRPGLPFTTKTMADGSQRRMWTTFTPHQIDIDVRSPATRAYLSDVLGRFAGAGISQVRLDAVGYAIKTPGTSCFMIPETLDFVRQVGNEVNELGMESLLEIHSHYENQIASSQTADRVYDFALPPLLLHSLFSGSALALRNWLELSPRNAVTVLDTHDGIGVIDVGPAGSRPGLLTPREMDDLIDGIHSRSSGESLLATGVAASNLDLYQVNCTYYSALGCNDNDYLLARLAQLLSPGVPQVYYAGLLAAPNDVRLLEETGVGRDINRPTFTVDDINAALNRPVVQQLMALCRLRNTHPAFSGEFELGGRSDHELDIRWRSPGGEIAARIDFVAKSFELELTTEDITRRMTSWKQL